MKNLKFTVPTLVFLFAWVSVIASPPLPNGVYKIRWWNGKVLDAYGDETNLNGGRVILHDFHGGNNQLWQVSFLSTNRYKITCLQGGKSLDAYGTDVNTDGCRVMQHDYHGGNNQQWILEDKGSGKYLIRCAASTRSKVIMPYDAEEVNGTKIVLWSSYNGNNQMWAFEKVALGKKVSITVGSGGDDLRKGVGFDLLLRDGRVISNAGWIGSVPNFTKKTGFFNIREVKSSDIKAVLLKFDPSPTNPFETPDNWDFNCIKLTFHFNDGSSVSLLDKCGLSPGSSNGPLIHRFTNNSRELRVDVY